MNTIPATQNEAWGFFGTMEALAPAAWPLAMTAISDGTGQPLESVRSFLDSRFGRHFADAVRGQIICGATLQEAIIAACRQWMTWRTNHFDRRDFGIPVGTPQLIGFVIFCEASG
jgi:hypothetical protein